MTPDTMTFDRALAAIYDSTRPLAVGLAVVVLAAAACGGDAASSAAGDSGGRRGDTGVGVMDAGGGRDSGARDEDGGAGIDGGDGDGDTGDGGRTICGLAPCADGWVCCPPCPSAHALDSCEPGPSCRDMPCPKDDAGPPMGCSAERERCDLRDCCAGLMCFERRFEVSFCVPIGGSCRAEGEGCDAVTGCCEGFACIRETCAAFPVTCDSDEDCSTPDGTLVCCPTTMRCYDTRCVSCCS